LELGQKIKKIYSWNLLPFYQQVFFSFVSGYAKKICALLEKKVVSDCFYIHLNRPEKIFLNFIYSVEKILSAQANRAKN
jgi:hypothetical protein